MAYVAYKIHVCYPIAAAPEAALTATPSSTIIREGRCKLPDEGLFWASMQLFDDQLVLSGWTWSGQYERAISLQHVDEVRWINNPDVPGNLVLCLTSGEMITVAVKGAGMWKYAIDEQCGHGLRSVRFEDVSVTPLAYAA